MQTIIEYFQNAYTKNQIAFFIILGIVLFLGLIITLAVAIIGTIIKVNRRKLAENTSLAELYLLISDLDDRLEETENSLSAEGLSSEEKSKLLKKKKSIKSEKAKYEDRLKSLLHTDMGDYTMEEAKEFTEEQVRRKIKKIEKESEEPVALQQQNITENETTAQNDVSDDETTATVIYDQLSDDDEVQAETVESAKWIISSENGEFKANLQLGGEILISTMPYTSLSGVKSAIITLKKNLEEENCAVTVDEEENFIFKVFSASGKLLSESKKFSSKQTCEWALGRAKTFADAEVAE